MGVMVLAILTWSILGGANAKVIGNGGSTVVCKDAKGQVNQTEVFDLYEGRVLNGLSYHESSEDHIAQASKIITHVAEVLQQKPDVEGSVTDLFEMLQKALVFLPPGVGLKTVPDAEEFIAPKGCEIIQTINFRDFTHVYVDSDVWGELSETQKAALLVHETLYWYLRTPGPKGNLVETNSIRTRKAVALLFSGVQFEGLEIFKDHNGMMPVYCKTMEALEADRPTSVFYIFPTQEGGLTFQFIKLLDRRLLTRATLNLQAPQDLSQWPLSSQQQAVWNIHGTLNSLMDSDFSLTVDWWPRNPEHNKIHIRDSDGNSSWESFVCE